MYYSIFTYVKYCREFNVIVFCVLVIIAFRTPLHQSFMNSLLKPCDNYVSNNQIVLQCCICHGHLADINYEFINHYEIGASILNATLFKGPSAKSRYKLRYISRHNVLDSDGSCAEFLCAFNIIQKHWELHRPT